MIVKFHEQFWGGLLVGAALATLLVGSMAFKRIQVNHDFAAQQADLFITALKDIEELKTACDSECQGIKLRYPGKMKDYGYKD